MNSPAENSHEPALPAPSAKLAAETAAASKLPKNVAANAEPIVDPSKLTPEEQMALFEKDLKENDWGHQPC